MNSSYIIIILTIVLMSYQIHQMSILTTQLNNLHNTSIIQNITCSLPLNVEKEVTFYDKPALQIEIKKETVDERDEEEESESTIVSQNQDHEEDEHPKEQQRLDQSVKPIFVSTQLFNQSYVYLLYY